MPHTCSRERMDPLAKISLAFFFSLVISHLAVDFVLQPDRWVRDKIGKKWRSPYLYVHSILAGLLAGLVTLYFCGFVLAGAVFFVVYITHFIIDGLKAHFTDKEGASVTCKDIYLFFGDQVLHCIVLIVLWGLICAQNLPLSSPYLDDATIYTITVLLLGYLIILWPGGFFIAKIMSYIGLNANKEKKEVDIGSNADKEKKEAEDDGLKNAGTYIGYLERLLILFFILADQYVAIGFLVGAKAIFRYTDSRTVSEYILTGTLLSYSVAIIAGMGIEYLLTIP